jgi:hypothetical protein
MNTSTQTNVCAYRFLAREKREEEENRTERTLEPRANVVVVTISMTRGIEAMSTTTAKDSDSVSTSLK